MNIFNETQHRYFQLPYFVLPFLPVLTKNELALYVWLLSEAQHGTKGTVRATINDIPVSKNGVQKAREGLVSHKLITAVKENSVYAYTFIDPTTGAPIKSETKKRTSDAEIINFDSLTAKELDDFFESYLTYAVPSENGISCRCPFPGHTDVNNSFSIELRDGGGGRWKCFGCKKGGKLIDFIINLSPTPLSRKQAHQRVTSRLNGLRAGQTGDGVTTDQPMAKKRAKKLPSLNPDDVAHYYVDEEGEIAYMKVRRHGDKQKTKRYTLNPDAGSNLLYRLPELIEAETVCYVEGESDAEAILSLGIEDASSYRLEATTLAAGSNSKLEAGHIRYLKNKYVVLIGDTDEVGREYMDRIEAELTGEVKALRRVHIPSAYKDIRDWLQGRSAEQFVELVGEDWLDIPTAI